MIALTKASLQSYTPRLIFTYHRDRGIVTLRCGPSLVTTLGIIQIVKVRFMLPFVLGYLLAQAEPEFIGVFSSEASGTQFIVVVEPGTPPRWAKLGQIVSGYTVLEYREKDETLLLRKDNRALALKLKASKVQQADLRYQPMPLQAAKQLIASQDSWDSDVSYTIFRDKDGNWCLAAMKKVEAGIALRFQLLAPESIPAGSPEIVEKDRPIKE